MRRAQYCDLPHDAQLAVTAWAVAAGAPPAPAGGAAMPLFSKKGRLKTGLQRVRLWPGRRADAACPSATPGKLPVAERGELGCAPAVHSPNPTPPHPFVCWISCVGLAAISPPYHNDHGKM